jgi:hypothetical protein
MPEPTASHALPPKLNTSSLSCDPAYPSNRTCRYQLPAAGFEELVIAAMMFTLPQGSTAVSRWINASTVKSSMIGVIVVVSTVVSKSADAALLPPEGTEK